MAFDLEPGEYSLELTYLPAGARAGLAVSAVCIGLTVIWLWVQRYRVKRSPRVKTP